MISPDYISVQIYSDFWLLFFVFSIRFTIQENNRVQFVKNQRIGIVVVERSWIRELSFDSWASELLFELWVACVLSIIERLILCELHWNNAKSSYTLLAEWDSHKIFHWRVGHWRYQPSWKFDWKWIKADCTSGADPESRTHNTLISLASNSCLGTNMRD